MNNSNIWNKELAPVKEFKIGLIADEASKNLDEAAALAKYFGASGLEIRTAFGKQLVDLTEEDILQIKQILAKHNMVCCGIGSPFFKCKPEEADEHLKTLDQYIAIAKELNTNKIRGFAFWRSDECSLDDMLPIIKEKLTEVAKKLRAANMILVLENEPSTYDTDAAATAKIIKEVNLPEIQALWDPGNDTYAYTREIPYPDGYNALRPYIQHIHIKDSKRNENDKAISVRFGDGSVNYTEQFACLSNEGYVGWLVLEPHYYRESSPLSEKTVVDLKHLELTGGMRSTAECFEQFIAFLSEQGYFIKK